MKPTVATGKGHNVVATSTFSSTSTDHVGSNTTRVTSNATPGRGEVKHRLNRVRADLRRIKEQVVEGIFTTEGENSMYGRLLDLEYVYEWFLGRHKESPNEKIWHD